MGMGVTGGTPQGFDVGLEPGSPGSIGIKGIDLVGRGAGSRGVGRGGAGRGGAGRGGAGWA
jgi:hypothetical protein